MTFGDRPWATGGSIGFRRSACWLPVSPPSRSASAAARSTTSNSAPATSIAARAYLAPGHASTTTRSASSISAARKSAFVPPILLLVDSLACACELGGHGPVPRQTVALVGLACREAAAAAVHAVDVACQLTGSASVRDGSTLERRRRDIDTLRKHQVLWPNHEVPLGRQIAGIPTVAFPFLSGPLTPEECQ